LRCRPPRVSRCFCLIAGLEADVKEGTVAVEKVGAQGRERLVLELAGGGVNVVRACRPRRFPRADSTPIVFRAGVSLVDQLGRY